MSTMKELQDIGDKLDSKLDKIDERLSGIDITLVKNTAELEHHIYRTALSEQNIELLRIEFKPLQKRHEAVNAIFRVVGMCATGLGLMIGLAKLVMEYIF